MQSLRKLFDRNTEFFKKKIYYYFYFGEPSFFVYWWRWICSPECHKWLLITRVHACAEEIIVFCCFPKNITLAFLRMDWHFSTCFRHSWSCLVINLEDVVMSISPSLCLSSFLIISSVWNKIWVIGWQYMGLYNNLAWLPNSRNRVFSLYYNCVLGLLEKREVWLRPSWLWDLRFFPTFWD